MSKTLIRMFFLYEFNNTQTIKLSVISDFQGYACDIASGIMQHLIIDEQCSEQTRNSFLLAV